MKSWNTICYPPLRFVFSRTMEIKGFPQMPLPPGWTPFGRGLNSADAADFSTPLILKIVREGTNHGGGFLLCLLSFIAKSNANACGGMGFVVICYIGHKLSWPNNGEVYKRPESHREGHPFESCILHKKVSVDPGTFHFYKVQLVRVFILCYDSNMTGIIFRIEFHQPSFYILFLICCTLH